MEMAPILSEPTVSDCSAAALEDFFERTLSLSANLRFVGQLLDSHVLLPNQEAHCRAKCASIWARAADPKLYLAVVGEFSAGKSTMINALIRRDLLKSDVLPGTTVAATFIHAAPEEAERVVVEFDDGSERVIEGAQEDNFRDLVHQVTAVERYSKNIRRVRISLPAETEDHLVIIDTPGTNTENPRHGEITEATIRDYADAALIICSATQPLPVTLCDFLRRNLSDCLHRCLFAITKIDLVPEEERGKLIDNTRWRYASEFDLDEPEVLPMAPLVVALKSSQESAAAKMLAALELKWTLEGMAKLEADYLASERECRRFLLEQRKIILSEKLAGLLNELLNSLRAGLHARECEYLERKLKLDQNRIPDLENFISGQKQEHRKFFESDAGTYRSSAIRKVEISKGNLSQELRNLIAAATSASELKAASNRAADRIANECDKLQNQLNTAHEEIRRCGERQLGIFKEEFKALFRTLEVLGAKLPELEGRTLNGVSSTTAASRYLTAAVNSVDNHIKKEENLAGTNAARAAMVGFWLGGPLGAAVGGVIGWVGGTWWNSQSFPTIKSQCSDNVNQATSAALDDMKRRGDESLTASIQKTALALESEIGRYFSYYGEIVRQLIAADEQAAAALHVEQQQNADAAKQICGRLEALAEVKRQLKSVSHESLTPI